MIFLCSLKGYIQNSLKVHYIDLGGGTFQSEEKNLYWLIFVTTQFHTIFALFVCGGPCHLSIFKQCSRTLFSSENSLFIHYMVPI